MGPKGRCVTLRPRYVRCFIAVRYTTEGAGAPEGVFGTRRIHRPPLFVLFHLAAHARRRMRTRHNTSGALSIFLYIASHHASLLISDHQLHNLLLILSNLLLAFTCNRNKLWAPSLLSPSFLRAMAVSTMLSRTGCLQAVAGLPSLGASQVRSSNAGKSLLAKLKIRAPLSQLEKRTLVVSAQQDNTPLVSE